MQSPKKNRKNEKLEKLGVGAYGSVYKVREFESNKLFALKKMKVYENEESLAVHVIRETAILKSISHPNIIKLYRVEIDKPKNQAKLFFELMEENLKSVIDNSQLTYGFLKSLTRQLLEGLFFMHHNQLIHRDIKPLNILLNRSEGILKIADFGLAKAVGLPIGELSLEVQTLWYKAPELLLGDENYDMAVDCWAAGCVIGEMVMGRPVFSETSEISQIFRIFEVIGSPTEGHYLTCLPFYKRSFPKFRQVRLRSVFGNCEADLIDLIEGLLNLDPKIRLSAGEALKMAFLI